MSKISKGIGCILGLCANVVAVAAAVAYLVFAFSSGTFNILVLLAFLAAICCGAVLFFTDNFFSDYLVIINALLITIAFGLFMLDSVGDFTDFFSGIVMYGNPQNVPTRFVIIGITLGSILLELVSSFLNRNKKQ